MRFGQKTKVIFEEELLFTSEDTPEDLWDEDKVRKIKVESEDEEEETLLAQTKFLEIDSHNIKIDEDLGKFPYNIVKWETNFDIDLEVSTEEKTGDGPDDSYDVRMATLTIYNPPENISYQTNLPRYSERIDIDKYIDTGKVKKNIVIKSGFYHNNRGSLPILFRGKITRMEYNQEGGEAELVIEAESSPELNSFASSGNYRGPFGKVVEKICENAGITLGTLPLQLSVLDDGEETFINLYEDDSYIKISISEEDTILSAISKAIEKLRKEHGIKLKKQVHGGMLSIVPPDWKVRTGIQLTPSAGLISAKKSEDENVSSDMADEESMDWELEGIFIPTITLNDIIKFRRNEYSEWKFIEVKEYSHEVPHDGSATTTISGTNINIEPGADDAELYTLEKINPYSEPQGGFTIHELGD